MQFLKEQYLLQKYQSFCFYLADEVLYIFIFMIQTKFFQKFVLYYDKHYGCKIVLLNCSHTKKRNKTQFFVLDIFWRYVANYRYRKR